MQKLISPLPDHQIADIHFEHRIGYNPAVARKFLYALLVFLLISGVWFTTGHTRDKRENSSSPHAMLMYSATEPSQSPRTTMTRGENTENTQVNPEELTNQHKEQESVVVSIQGQVMKPGLIRLSPGMRVGEALEVAGGLQEGVQVYQINFAEEIEDGMQIIIDNDRSTILRAGENPPNVDSSPPFPENRESMGGEKAHSSSTATQININRASSAELMELPGVGPKTAEAIVSHRETHGEFGSVEDILSVKGIGPSKYEALKESITV